MHIVGFFFCAVKKRPISVLGIEVWKMRRWTEQNLWSHSREEEGKVSLMSSFSLIHGQLSPSFPNHDLLHSTSHSHYISIPQPWLLPLLSGTASKQHNLNLHLSSDPCKAASELYIFLRKLFKSRSKTFPECCTCSIQSQTWVQKE